jgi:hypothetical protein
LAQIQPEEIDKPRKTRLPLLASKRPLSKRRRKKPILSRSSDVSMKKESEKKVVL